MSTATTMDGRALTTHLCDYKHPMKCFARFTVFAKERREYHSWIQKDACGKHIAQALNECSDAYSIEVRLNS